MSSQALRLFRRLGGSSPGRWLYSKLICRRAPYFASIAPRVEALAPGRCVVRIRDRRAVRNHIGTVHAIALCNMAELAGGLATDATIPGSARWIPKGMTVRYLAKARGEMTATAKVAAIADASSAQDLHARVEVRDEGGTLVFDADIAMWVSPRKET
ncbi:hotdog fold domain-containing protein [Dokdonella sp.]|uniref:hotdog fold domain-containing protein n=1 Tax=Dokdonella sp. TaxID=2291710 RepID=UPI00260A5FAD|nr:hotdog fold domain-containing protein [Dokdonella sp.]